MKTVPNEQTQQWTDDHIIKTVLNGEKSYFELLVRRYNQRLFRIGMPLLNNDMEVEDTMQVAYINAYEHLHQFRGQAGFGTWLTRIFVNECYSVLRKRKRLTDIKDHIADDKTQKTVVMNPPDHLLINKELNKAIEDAIVNLPEKYRLVFVLREVEDMSIADTVDILGITDTNVKVRLSRAKAMLRDSLQRYYRNDSLFHFHLTRCDRIVAKVMEAIQLSA